MHRRWEKRPPGEASHLNPEAKAVRGAWFHQALISVAGKTLYNLPGTTADLVGALLGRLSYAFSATRRAKANQNLRIALGAVYNSSRIDKIQKASVMNRGKMAVDYLLADHFRAGDFTKMVSVEGQDQLESALSSGRGVILACAHFGSLDLGLWMIARSGIPVTLADRNIDHPFFRTWVRRLRLRHGVRTLFDPFDRQEILDRLAANECVAFPIDRSADRDNGVIVHFCKRRVVAHRTIAEIVEQHPCPVLIYRSERSNPGRHRVVIGPPVKKPTGVGVDFLRDMTQACVSAWENIILRAPEQWNWGHDQFSLRP